MHLTQRTASSYHCADHIALAAWLIEQGYRSIDPRSEHEYLRLQRGRSLIVIYHSSSVLLQGSDLETPRALFASLQTTQPVLF